MISIASRRAVAAVSLALLSVGVQADEAKSNFSLNGAVGVVSDYRAFGPSASQRKPAVQLEGYLNHSSGLFLGLWSSTANFGRPAIKVYREDSYMIGYAGVLAEDINISGFVAQFEYPNQTSFNAKELWLTASYRNWYAHYILNFDYRGTIPNKKTYLGEYRFALPHDSTLALKVGKSDLQRDIVAAGHATRQGYYVWGAKLSKKMWDIDWSLEYVKTNLSKSQCVAAFGITGDICKPAVVLGARKAF